MTLHYLQQKGVTVWHATEAGNPSAQYETLCGRTLDRRHLSGGPTTDEPKTAAAYCRECWEVEANNT